MRPPNILSCNKAHSEYQAHQASGLLFSTHLYLYACSCFKLYSSCAAGPTWASRGEAFSHFHLPHVLLGCVPLCPTLVPALSFVMFPENVNNFDSVLNKTKPWGFSWGKCTVCFFFLKENMSNLDDQSHHRFPPLVQETANSLRRVVVVMAGLRRKVSVYARWKETHRTSGSDIILQDIFISLRHFMLSIYILKIKLIHS